MSKKVQVLTETVKRLIQCRADENLKNIINKSHAADVAYVLGQLSSEQQTFVFSFLQNTEKKAEVLSELSRNEVAVLLENLGVQTAAEILSHVSPDDSADILEVLPEEFSSAILSKLKKEEAEEVQELIRHNPDSAGGIMSPNVFALHEDFTVSAAIERIQNSSDAETVFYVYVTNLQDQLVGVVSLKRLLLASPQAHLKDIMDKDPIRVRHDEDQEEVARIVSRYNFLSVPVVDETNKLVGIVTVDDVIDVIREEAQEDLLLMAGANRQMTEESTFVERLKGRLMWFLLSLVGGIISSEIIASYFPASIPFRFFVSFIPFLVGVTGSIGTQSMAIVVSSISGGALSFARIMKMMRKEFLVALVLGVVFGGCLMGYLALRFPVSGMLPVAVGSSIMLTLLIASIIGTILPLLFQKIGVDPAVATGPFVTALVHLLCIWIYFSFGSQWTSFAS